MTARDVPGFGSINHRTDISSFVVSVADFIGGLILMYRCWIIWDRNYLVAVAPILTSIAALPTAICLVWNLTGNLTWENDTPKASAAIMPLGRAAYILPLCTNVLTTGLILVRLWWVSRAVGTASMTRKAMHVVVESGLLYFLVQLVFVVVFCARSDSAMLMIAIVVQVYGIASTLIIIHIGLGLSSEQGKGAAVASRMSFSSTAGMRRQGPVIGAAGGTVEYNVQRPFDVYETYGRKMGMAVRQENIQRTVSNEEHPFDMIVEIGRE
ncbi:hypothetical protein PsYK624_015600 [Phanerochaete sordida]|uniref:Uncharacterized protein n=1 Tax=Phanerochaete sordida TaxID=48140 RepID=A0A9P3L7V8_9APHY|nr:hypothetical protein PsYK624_015600 [Phanerochaete sordida]